MQAPPPGPHVGSAPPLQRCFRPSYPFQSRFSVCVPTGLTALCLRQRPHSARPQPGTLPWGLDSDARGLRPSGQGDLGLLLPVLEPGPLCPEDIQLPCGEGLGQGGRPPANSQH